MLELLYPWKFSELLPLKKQFLIQARDNKNDTQLKIGFIGGYTAYDVAEWLEIFCFNSQISCEVKTSKWGAAHQLCLDPGQLNNDFNLYILMVSWRDLLSNDTFGHILVKENDILNLFTSFWNNAKEREQNVIQCLYTLPHYISISPSNTANAYQYIRDINTKLISESQAYSNVIINYNDLTTHIHGSLNFQDDRNWHAYGQPHGVKGTIVLSHQLSVGVRSLYGHQKKLLIVDLDNTLWGGVIGDDGIENIKIGPDTAEGRPFYDLQVYIKSLHEQGVLLAICSKNDEKIACSGFNHSGMYLKIEDFVAKKINWNHKSENIISICRDLNLGMESVVFIDDNPIERQEVRINLPNVCVPEIGSDPSEYLKILDLNQFFSHHGKITDEDKTRSKSYEDNKKRAALASSLIDHDMFLQSLETKLLIGQFSAQNTRRVQQLFNKTNQFNLNTVRLDNKKIEMISNSEKHITMTASASDKFGNYGLISALYGTIDNNTLVIKNWVMSCRVFNRSFELAIFEELVKICTGMKINTIIGTYVPTPKNAIISSLYSELGFTQACEEPDSTNKFTKWSILINQNMTVFQHYCEVQNDRK
jgi:FkbH-like protein